jgi:hypothetical protein
MKDFNPKSKLAEFTIREVQAEKLRLVKWGKARSFCGDNTFSKINE